MQAYCLQQISRQHDKRCERCRGREREAERGGERKVKGDSKCECIYTFANTNTSTTRQLQTCNIQICVQSKTGDKQEEHGGPARTNWK